MIYTDLAPSQRLRLNQDAWMVGNWSQGTSVDVLIAKNSEFTVGEVTELWASVTCGSVASLIYPSSNNRFCWTADMFDLI